MLAIRSQPPPTLSLDWHKVTRIWRYNHKSRSTIISKCRIRTHKNGTKRKFDATQQAALTTCSWITKGENLLISGPTGVGKWYLASARGQQACSNGFKVMYNDAQKMFYDLKLAKIEGTHHKIINQMAKTALLTLDDLGLQKLDDTNRWDLLKNHRGSAWNKANHHRCSSAHNPLVRPRWRAHHQRCNSRQIDC